MRIALLGATGRTGALVITEAQAHGHQVTAFGASLDGVYEVLRSFPEAKEGQYDAVQRPLISSLTSNRVMPAWGLGTNVRHCGP